MRFREEKTKEVKESKHLEHLYDMCLATWNKLSSDKRKKYDNNINNFFKRTTGYEPLD